MKFLRWIFLSVGLLPAIAGCSPGLVLLEELPGKVTSYRLMDADPPANPPHAGFRDFRFPEYEQRISAITARISGVISFLRGEPEPLFSGLQTVSIAKVLAKEMPKLGATERLYFKVAHHSRKKMIEVEIYPDGNTLVYRFRALVQDQDPQNKQMSPVNYAKLVPIANQSISQDGQVTSLQDPVFGKAAVAENFSSLVDRLIQEIQPARVIPPKEKKDILAALEKYPQKAEFRLREYLVHRKALEQARQENLLTEQEFSQRIERLLLALRSDNQ